MSFFLRKKQLADRPDDPGDDYLGLERGVALFEGGMHPHIAPFDNSRINPMMVDSIDPLAGLMSPVDGHVPSVQNADTNLEYLRSMFPFVPIMPFPQATRTVLLTQNIALDIPVDNFALARFKGNGDYYVNAQGAAASPTAANMGPNYDQNASLYKPEDSFYYIGGLKQISLFASGIGVVVCVSLYSTNNRPQNY